MIHVVIDTAPGRTILDTTRMHGKSHTVCCMTYLLLVQVSAVDYTVESSGRDKELLDEVDALVSAVTAPKPTTLHEVNALVSAMTGPRHLQDSLSPEASPSPSPEASPGPTTVQVTPTPPSPPTWPPPNVPSPLCPPLPSYPPLIPPPPDLCFNDCAANVVGRCQDGGPDSLWAVCDYGHDCNDCNPRPILPAPNAPLIAPPLPPLSPGNIVFQRLALDVTFHFAPARIDPPTKTAFGRALRRLAGNHCSPEKGVNVTAPRCVIQWTGRFVQGLSTNTSFRATWLDADTSIVDEPTPTLVTVPARGSRWRRNQLIQILIGNHYMGLTRSLREAGLTSSVILSSNPVVESRDDVPGAAILPPSVPPSPRQPPQPFLPPSPPPPITPPPSPRPTSPPPAAPPGLCSNSCNQRGGIRGRCDDGVPSPGEGMGVNTFVFSGASTCQYVAGMAPQHSTTCANLVDNCAVLIFVRTRLCHSSHLVLHARASRLHAHVLMPQSVAAWLFFARLFL